MQQPTMCPKCGSPNALDQRFCWNCGTTLVAGCPNCGASLDPGARFCGNCGAQLPLPPPQPGWGQPPPQQPGWDQPPPQQPGWGQPPPQQAGWGQPPPQPGWGQPPPPQPGWGQPPPQPGWNQPPPQPGWNQPPPQQPVWGQPTGRQKSGAAAWMVILLVVLLIGLGTLGYFAFFSDNPPWGGSSSSSTVTGAIEEGPFPFLISTDNVTGNANMEIRWKTADLYIGQIEYGTDTSYGSTSDWEADFVRDHEVSLPDLELAASYSYRIILKNQQDQEWMSNNYTFTTPSAE